MTNGQILSESYVSHEGLMASGGFGFPLVAPPLKADCIGCQNGMRAYRVDSGAYNPPPAESRRGMHTRTKWHHSLYKQATKRFDLARQFPLPKWLPSSLVDSVAIRTGRPRVF